MQVRAIRSNSLHRNCDSDSRQRLFQPVQTAGQAVVAAVLGRPHISDNPVQPVQRRLHPPPLSHSFEAAQSVLSSFSVRAEVIRSEPSTPVNCVCLSMSVRTVPPAVAAAVVLLLHHPAVRERVSNKPSLRTAPNTIRLKPEPTFDRCESPSRYYYFNSTASKIRPPPGLKKQRTVTEQQHRHLLLLDDVSSDDF